MIENEYLAALRLQNIPLVGDISAKKLIAHCGSPSAVFHDKKSALIRIEGIGRAMVGSLFNPSYQQEAERELAFIQRNNIRCHLFTEAEYPAYLKHCIDGPILLFSTGNIDLRDQKIISVVGTRNMTSYGRSFCEKFIEEIAVLNPVIVSGFAYGVDICIQREAANHGLQTIGCLAHGLNQIYPRSHGVYVSQIREKGGFLTEFWSTSRPERENFLRRNRVIAGMSQATIVVESGEKGGSLVTADLAAGYQRDVFAVPGRTDAPYSLGCNNLIKQHKAQLISSAADLIYQLNWDLDSEEVKPVQRQLFPELDDKESLIYEYLCEHGKQQLDSIAINCKLRIFEVSSILLGMEMKGVIRVLPGKIFEAIR